MLSTLLLLVCAQSDADAGAGVLTRAPAIIRQVEAAFPPDALDAGVGGTVVMQVDLDEQGHVSDAVMLESAGRADLDQAALAAVRQFIFSPAEVDGRPAPVRLRYSYQFFFHPPAAPEVPDAGPRLNFSGVLVERGTRLAVAGAQVVVGEQEAMSDESGRFTVADVPLGTQRVVVLAPEYERFEVSEDFAAGRRTDVTYFVRRKQYGSGFETVVRGQRERKEVAQVALKQEEIRLIPGTNGDAFRVVQNLPGVARTPFGLGQLVVRGGKAWDTRTYVDEISIPQLFHFGGLYATFNSNLLEQLEFSPGNYGAEFGRAIGGLVKAEVRTPSKKGYHGLVDVNLVDASALLEGPVGDDWSVSLSGRRSYIDALLPFIFANIVPVFAPQAKNALSFTVAPRYYDYQFRLERRPKNGKSRFFISVFGSDDQLALLLPNPAIDPEGRGTFGTRLNYNRLVVGLDLSLSDKVKFISRNSAGLDALDLTIGSDIYIHGTQYPVQLRESVVIEAAKALTISTGLDFSLMPVVSNTQSIQLPSLNRIPDPFLSRQLVVERSVTNYTEPAVFVEGVWSPLPGLKLVPGVRADYDFYMKKGWVDPRLAVFFTPWEDVTFKAAAGLYHQTPDYRIGQLSAVFGNPDLKPEGALQYMLGLEKRFSDSVNLDVQGYYKDLFNQARATLVPNSVDPSMPSMQPRYLSNGYGRSYGVEVLLRHQLTRNFFGWVAYSLSRTERDFRGGTQYAPGAYDQPHNLIVVGSYKLPYDFIVGAKVRFVSGPLNTPTLGAIYDANGNYYFPLQGAENSRRLPDFFQLDLRIDKRFVFRDWMLALYVDCQNVTNRANVEGVVNNFNYTKEAYLTGLPILPVLGARAEW